MREQDKFYCECGNRKLSGWKYCDKCGPAMREAKDVLFDNELPTDFKTREELRLVLKVVKLQDKLREAHNRQAEARAIIEQLLHESSVSSEQ